MKTFLKILGVVVIIVLVVLVIFFFMKGTKSSNSNPSTVATNTQTSTTVGTLPDTSTKLTFSDSVHNVTYQYPNDMVLSQGGILSDTIGTMYAISSVGLPATFEPKTNFGNATFTVGYSADIKAVAECSNPQNGEVALGTTLINGVFFSKFSLNDAGAGNFYNTTSYRTIYNNQCYVVEYTIHTTNIGNYDPSQGISQFDKNAVVTKMEGIVQSFKFLK